MAKFDSNYPEQLSAEENDMFLIASAQNGNIMKMSLKTLKEQIQHHLAIIDEQLSNTSEHPVQNKVITENIRELRRYITAITSRIDSLEPLIYAGL